MADLIVLQNDMNQDGVRRVHVMAPLAFGHPPISKIEMGGVNIEIPEWAEVEIWEDEIRLHHLKVTWLAREAIYFTFPQEGTGKEHPMVVWAMDPPAAPLSSPLSPGLDTPEEHRLLDHRAASPHFKDRNRGKGRISEAAVDAALVFFSTFDYWPSAAWVRTWPKGLTVEKAYIPLGEDVGMDLFAVPWALSGFVIVGGSFNKNRSRYE